MVTPTIRGTGIQASSAASYVVSWPSGTLAGDMALVFIGSGSAPNTPTGWTVVDNQTGSGFNGSIFSKLLTSTDISAGSVTVTTSFSSDSAIVILTMVVTSATVVKASPNTQRNSATNASVTLTSTGHYAWGTADLFAYFGSVHSNTVPTVSPGTMQRQANANASGALYTQSGSGIPASVTFTYPTPGSSGNYQAIVAVGEQFATPPNVVVITAGPWGPGHQVVKPPASNVLTGSTPVPVGSALKGGTVGVAYSETISATGGTAPYTFSSTGTLPTGTGLNSSTGVISGTPTTAGTFNFTVTVTDAGLNTGSQPFTIVIAAPSAAPAANYGYTA